MAPAGQSGALAQRLQSGPAAALLEAEEAADVMLAEDDAELRARAIAVVTEQPAPGGLPAFGSASLDALRALIESAQAQPSRT